MEEKLTFYDYGVRIAAKSNDEIEKLANSIGEKYGSEAKDEFEIGVAASIKVNANYDRFKAVQEMIDSYNSKYHSKKVQPGNDWKTFILERIRNDYGDRPVNSISEDEKREIACRTIGLAFDYARKHYDYTEVQELFHQKK